MREEKIPGANVHLLSNNEMRAFLHGMPNPVTHGRKKRWPPKKRKDMIAALSTALCGNTAPGKIIGITGTLGAGKGTVVEFLMQRHSYQHMSVRSLLRKVIADRNLPDNRDSMTEVANDMRAKGGPGSIVEKMLTDAISDGRPTIIESIRTTAEAETLLRYGAELISVDAGVEARYERVHQRGSETDDVTFEKFKSDEEREWENDDPTKQNLKAVMQMATINLKNDTSVDDLHTEIAKKLKKIWKDTAEDETAPGEGGEAAAAAESEPAAAESAPAPVEHEQPAPAAAIAAPTQAAAPAADNETEAAVPASQSAALAAASQAAAALEAARRAAAAQGAPAPAAPTPAAPAPSAPPQAAPAQAAPAQAAAEQAPAAAAAPTLVGITGTLGAGKGTVVEYLMQKHGYAHMSVRRLLIQIIKERNMPVDRDSMTSVANELRAKGGPSVIVEQMLSEAQAAGHNCIIESIRTPAEAKVLKDSGAQLISVDAPQELRYQRIVTRGSSTDQRTFDEFKSDEAREMMNDDPNKQNLQAVMGMADVRLQNDTSVEDLHRALDLIF